LGFHLHQGCSVESLGGAVIGKYNMWVGTLSWGEIWEALAQCLVPGRIRTGPFIAEFENQFAAALGAPSAYSFATGRMALFAILQAIRAEGRDEVILPAYTCVVVASALLYAGCRPVYVDIEPDTFQINPRQVRASITSRTLAILAPHNFGFACDIHALRKIADECGVVLIEDCAHSLGATLDGRHLGTFGDFAFFSLDATKNLCTAFGGVAVVNNLAFRPSLERIHRETPFLSSIQTMRMVLYLFFLNLFCHPLLYRVGKYVMGAYRRSRLAFWFPGCDDVVRRTSYPYPARLSNAQCRLGIAQLRKLEPLTAHRREIHRLLSELIDGLFGLQKPALPKAVPAPLRICFLVKRREEFRHAVSDFIEVGTWFDTVLQNFNGDTRRFGYQPGQCPVAESVAEKIVNLPTSLRADYRLVSLWRQRLQDGEFVSRFAEQSHVPVGPPVAKPDESMLRCNSEAGPGVNPTSHPSLPPRSP